MIKFLFHTASALFVLLVHVVLILLEVAQLMFR